MLPRFLFVFMLGLIAGVSAAQDFKAGHAAASRGDFAAAIAHWQPLAQRGEPGAQYNLGMLYGRGDGVPKDLAVAAKWFLAAAEQGQVDAQARIGAMYARGLGGEQDYRQAARWLNEAAQHHHANAQYELGVLYANGQGVPQDSSSAYFWFALAALQHQPNAMNAQLELRERMPGAEVGMVEEKARKWLEETIGAKFEPAQDGAQKH